MTIKAIKEYCDGLSAYLGECPQGAIIIEERAAEEFDEEAAQLHLEEEKSAREVLPCGCSSATVTRFKDVTVSTKGDLMVAY